MWDPAICWVFSGHRLCASWADTPGWVTQTASLQKSAKGEGGESRGKLENSPAVPLCLLNTLFKEICISWCTFAFFFFFLQFEVRLVKVRPRQPFFLEALCFETQLLCVLLSILEQTGCLSLCSWSEAKFCGVCWNVCSRRRLINKTP